MADDEGSVSLKRITSGILQAFCDAKYLSDTESARLIEVYKKEKLASMFTVPAFTISDAEIELRFAIESPVEENSEEEIPDIKVNISPKILEKLGAERVSVMRFKVSPVNIRIFEE